VYNGPSLASTSEQCIKRISLPSLVPIRKDGKLNACQYNVMAGAPLNLTSWCPSVAFKSVQTSQNLLLDQCHELSIRRPDNLEDLNNGRRRWRRRYRIRLQRRTLALVDTRDSITNVSLRVWVSLPVKPTIISQASNMYQLN
jgi:hypothetical protein